jgi:glutamate dehydrogenase
MIAQFDLTKLSPEGYRVLVDEKDSGRPPQGTNTSNFSCERRWYVLRKTMPLWTTSPSQEKFDVFVPCGGRPESIDLASVGKLLRDNKAINVLLVHQDTVALGGELGQVKLGDHRALLGQADELHGLP